MQDNLTLFKEQVDDSVTIIPVSTITRDNIEQLLYAIADKLDEVKDIDFSVDNDEEIGVNRVLYINTRLLKINSLSLETTMVRM